MDSNHRLTRRIWPGALPLSYSPVSQQSLSPNDDKHYLCSPEYPRLVLDYWDFRIRTVLVKKGGLEPPTRYRPADFLVVLYQLSYFFWTTAFMECSTLHLLSVYFLPGGNVLLRLSTIFIASWNVHELGKHISSSGPLSMIRLISGLILVSLLPPNTYPTTLGVLNQ